VLDAWRFFMHFNAHLRRMSIHYPLIERRIVPPSPAGIAYRAPPPPSEKFSAPPKQGKQIKRSVAVCSQQFLTQFDTEIRCFNMLVSGVSKSYNYLY